jgi:hypothetical protein
MNKFARFALVGTSAAALANLSHAAAGAAVDVADVTGTISAQLVPVGLVGVAILGVTVAVAAFVWIKKGIH